ncbi:FKBP-type peptidyl-prolyl cis-trans isomerase [Candidatus Woesearchaeota archaeon]|nr:FKBP-type peptidyl-prolyl cis-trans isomerase [Candidatus Woesearchaeota archaeon]
MEKEDDELSIDFGKIWPFSKKQGKKRPEHPEKSDHDTETKGDEPEKLQEEPTEHHKTEKHAHEHRKAGKHEPQQTEEGEEIDLKEIGNKIKGLFKAKKDQKEKQPTDEEELSVDTKAISAFAARHKVIMLPALLILLAIYLSFTIRMMPSELAYTEDWARQTIYSFIRSDIGNVINSQYPNLPDDKKNSLIEEELNKAIRSNSYTIRTGQFQGQNINIKEQVKGSADQYKSFFQDGKGNMYMPDIDPYYWLRYAKNIVDHGYPGDILKDGRSYDTLQLAPNGRYIEPEDTFHPYSIAILFSILSTLNPNTTLMEAQMILPVIIASFIILFSFLIARRIAGDIGGLFAAVMVAINPAFLTRSLYGHGDSDSWVLFFSVLAAYLFLEAIESKQAKWQIILATLSGLAIGLYSRFWGGWWYIFDFLIAASLVYAGYFVIANRNQLRNMKIISSPETKTLGLVLASFILMSGISVSLLSSPDTFILSPVSSLSFARIKTPVEASLWPNVLTTVAELNEGDVNSIINNVGGIFLFFTGLIGIMITMTKKRLDTTDLTFLFGSAVWWLTILIARNSLINSGLSQVGLILLLAVPIAARIAYAAIKSEHIDMKLAALLIIWFIVTMYASTKGIRFVMLIVPAFGIAFGATMGFLYRQINSLLPKTFSLDRKISSAATILLFVAPMLFFLVVPSTSLGAMSRSIASQDAPMINDAWYNALISIRDNSNKTAIITSWWDFGHHFKALAERPVTFDGTTQGSPQAHWVGQILRTDNEDMAIGILRMLDCGGNNAFEEMQKTNGNDTLKSVNALYSIFEEDREEAGETLKDRYGLSDSQAENVLKYTHCNPPEAFFIASEDMIGKAGVWAHFGSWNFERAYIWQKLRGKTIEEATREMQQKFGYTKEQADQTYFDIQNMNDAEGNSWVAPWPGYGQIDSCQTQGQTAHCSNGMKINLTNMDVYFTNREGQTGHPRSASYLTEDGAVKTTPYNQNVGVDLAATIIPEGQDYKIIFSFPDLNSSMFTRMFFMEGHSLEHFKLLTRQRSITGAEIYVYKVNWEGEEPTIKEELKKKETISQGDKVTFNYIGYLEDGSVFDSSVNNWRSINITKDDEFDQETSPFTFTTGNKEIIPGLEEEMMGMRKGEEKTIKVIPEKAYGTDPTAHPMGNKTLIFKIRIEEIK